MVKELSKDEFKEMKKELKKEKKPQKKAEPKKEMLKPDTVVDKKELKKPMKEAKKQKYLKATILLHYDKEDVKAVEHVEKKLLHDFGGFTRLGTCGGWWINQDGLEVEDTNLYLFVVIKEEQLEELKECLRKYKDMAKEEAVYLDYHPTNFELI